MNSQSPTPHYCVKAAIHAGQRCENQCLGCAAQAKGPLYLTPQGIKDESGNVIESMDALLRQLGSARSETAPLTHAQKMWPGAGVQTSAAVSATQPKHLGSWPSWEAFNRGDPSSDKNDARLRVFEAALDGFPQGNDEYGVYAQWYDGLLAMLHTIDVALPSARAAILEDAAKECDAISDKHKCDPVCDPCESHCGFESSACSESIRRIARGEPSYFTSVRVAPATTATGPVGSTDGGTDK